MDRIGTTTNNTIMPHKMSAKTKTQKKPRTQNTEDSISITGNANAGESSGAKKPNRQMPTQPLATIWKQ